MKRGHKGRYTMMAALVAFVFLILLASTSLTTLVYLGLYRFDEKAAAGLLKLPIPFLAQVLTSIVVGTSLTALTGDRYLRPFRKLTQATEEIAAGNYAVRVDVRSPRELANLAAGFNAMAARLSGVETLHTDFINNVSHEIKTPVMSIKGFARLLKKESISEENRREYLDIIIREAERLSKLSGNVLLLSKLENGQAVEARTEFPLDEQIRRAIVLLEPQWEKKRIELEVSLPPCPYVGNEELLEQVWLNLIDNAVKFTGEGGLVSVSLSQQAGAVRVSVSDTGIGMDADTLDHLFDKFFQGDRSHTTEGNGLGLSLIKRIVEQEGGQVLVHSAPQEGSTFTVVLPIGPGDSDEPGSVGADRV